MYLSQFSLNTFKENPADAEIASHQLMLRGGFIRRLASGLYSWLPLGMRVLNKVQTIIREEMDRAGALELLLPGVQPAELWQESKRWDAYGPALLRFKDRHDREFCLGPTHEEVITDIARNELKSYRQLPINYYQIQTKFRDEIRPRFGVMRAREFIMKDAYSFHIDEASLGETYALMRQTYRRIFDRLQLRYRIVQADTGEIGGSRSEEFQVLADSGEDVIAYSDTGEFAANIEVVDLPMPTTARPAPRETLEPVTTPDVGTIDALSRFLDVPAQACLKMLLVKGSDSAAVALLLRGDHELNAIKAQRLAGIAEPLTMLKSGEVEYRARGRGRDGLPSRLPRPRRPRPADVRRSVRRGHGRLRLRRERAGSPPSRRQLGARLAAAAHRRYSQCRRGRPEPRRRRPTSDRTRHRGRTDLPARDEIQRIHAGHGARSRRQAEIHADGLLRHRCDPCRCRGHRAEP